MLLYPFLFAFTALVISACSPASNTIPNVWLQPRPLGLSLQYLAAAYSTSLPASPVGISDVYVHKQAPDLSSCIFTISADGSPILPLSRPETTGSPLSHLFLCPIVNPSGTPGSSAFRRAPYPNHFPLLPLTHCRLSPGLGSSLLLGLPASVLVLLHLFSTQRPK